MMAEAVVQPPVPKPRSSRPQLSQTAPEPVDPRDTTDGPEDSKEPPSNAAPQPIPRQKSPANQMADSLPEDDSEPPDPEPSAPPLLLTAEEEDHTPTTITSSSGVVLRRFPFPKSRDENDDSAEEDDYENIDAHLDPNEREVMRRSDYINWVYVDSDGEEEGEGAGRPIGDRYAPSIKLDRHPALKKSQSTHDFETDSPSLAEAMAIKKQFQQHLQNLKSNKEGYRPKNRAPPPPPGLRSKRDKDQDQQQTQQSTSASKGGLMVNGSKTRHKRSQSDIHISSYSENDSNTTPTIEESSTTSASSSAVVRKSPKLNVQQGPARRSPLLPGKRHHRPSHDSSGASGSGSVTPSSGRRSPSGGGRGASNTPPSGRSPLAHQSRPHPPHGPPARPSPMATNSPRLRGQGPAPPPPPPSFQAHKDNKEKSKSKYTHVRLRSETGDDRQPKSKPGPPPERVQLDRHVSKDGNVKPKRQAPPPPRKMGGSPSDERAEETPPPAYATVVKPHRKQQQTSDESQSDRRMDLSSSGDSMNDPRPPKPVRMRRTQSVEDLSRVGSSPTPKPSSDYVLASMDVFTITLNKDASRSLGLVIVKGKARSASGDIVEGVFVQSILPNSLADNDGRIQSGDLLVRISNHDVLGVSIDEAIRLLKDQEESIQLRIARPDLSRASVYVVEGDNDSEQQIHGGQGASVKNGEVNVKLKETEQRVAELEGEKKDAEASLKAFKDEVQRERESLQEQLKEMRQMFDQHKSENENVSQLTRTLASVTVEKAKVEQALGDHKSEVETLSKKVQDAESAKDHADEEVRQYQAKLKTVEEAKQSLQLQVTDYTSQLKDTTDELNRVIEEKKCLWTELVGAREKITDLEERLKSNEDLIRNQREEITTLRIELARHSANHVHVETAIHPKAEGPPVESVTPPTEPSANTDTPKPEEDIKTPPTDGGSEAISHGKKEEAEGGDDDDDAFDNREPSPVVPHPYIEFLPFEPGSKPKRDKKPTQGETEAVKPEQPSDTAGGEDEESEENTSVQDTPPELPAKPAPQTEPQPEQKGNQEENKDPVANLYTAEPLQKLDSSAALHKSRVGGMRQRKRPSREHLLKMGSSSNLLDHIPDEQDTQPQSDETSEKSETVAVDQSTSVEQQLSPSETEQAPQSKPVPVARPRAAPRRKPGPTGDNKDKNKPPQALPRQKTDPTIEQTLSSAVPGPSSGKSDEKKPADAIKPSVPQTKESPKIQRKEPLLPGGTKLSPKAAHSPKTSPKHVAGQESTSPKREPILPPKPGQSEPKAADHSEGVSHSPKIGPKQHRKSVDEIDDVKIAELREKDPSELTVREKAILAQHTGHDKPGIKLPPPVPHKPKPPADGPLHATPEHDKEGSPVRSRTKSFDNDLETSSPRKRKLPPGAVNVFTGQLAPQERERSVTVSTTEPGARERSTLERHAALKEHSSDDHSPLTSSREEEKPSQGEVGASPKLEAKIPPKRPPPPGQRKHSNESPHSNMNDSQDELDGEPVAMSSSQSEGTQDQELVVNYDQILTWTPDVVGMWMSDIGLGQYCQIFTERGIQGYMLSDVDGHGLKGMGMESHEDRTQFKREVKRLKPFIDKHKKILEKQRKEEKKLAKKKKK